MQLYLPDWPFHNVRASKSVDWCFRTTDFEALTLGKSRLCNRVSSLKARLEKIRNSNEISQHKFCIYFFQMHPISWRFLQSRKTPRSQINFFNNKNNYCMEHCVIADLFNRCDWLYIVVDIIHTLTDSFPLISFFLTVIPSSETSLVIPWHDYSLLLIHDM